MNFHDLETASIRAEEIHDHVGLLAMAAEGMISDGDGINGRKIRGCAYALEMQMRTLVTELDRLVKVWQQEAIAGK